MLLRIKQNDIAHRKHASKPIPIGATLGSLFLHGIPGVQNTQHVS